MVAPKIKEKHRHAILLLGIGGTGSGIYATKTSLRGMSPNTLYTINVYAVNWVGTGAKATLEQYTSEI